MDTVDFIRDCFRQGELRLVATVEGLTDEQASWRPAAGANCIGSVLLHVAMAQDEMTARVRGEARALESAGWSSRFGAAARDPFSWGNGAEEDRLSDVVEYLTTVDRLLMTTIESMISDDLDRVIDEANPGQTVGTLLRHMITHKNNHHGQIDLLRGLQDPRWDLPRGTGVVLSPANRT